MLRLVLSAIAAYHAGSRYPGSTLDNFYLRCLHQLANGTPQGLNNLILPLMHGLLVCHGITYPDAKTPGILYLSQKLCRMQKSLGRNTAPVQAGTAQVGFFKQHHAPAQPAGLGGRRVTTGACPDYCNIIFHARPAFHILQPNNHKLANNPIFHVNLDKNM